MNRTEIKNEIKVLEDRISELKSRLRKPEYVDLGLPSGTLWATENESGEYTFDDAVKEFGDDMPKLWQLCELWENCTVEDEVLIGPNGNKIELPYGNYWSSKADNGYYAYCMYFDGSSVNMSSDNRSDAYSVRLCKSKKK